MNTIKQKIKVSPKGFTLLFAVLVATLVVAIGATIISISIRQTIPSGTSRDSQYAFYAANTALECAMYWDKIGVTPDPATLNSSVFPIIGESQSPNIAEAECNGVNLKKGLDGTSSTGDDLSFTPNNTSSTTVSTFKIQVSATSTASNQPPANLSTKKYCAIATITKKPASDWTTTGIFEVFISAFGYSSDCADTNPRKVERGVEIFYQG